MSAMVAYWGTVYQKMSQLIGRDLYRSPQMTRQVNQKLPRIVATVPLMKIAQRSMEQRKDGCNKKVNSKGQKTMKLKSNTHRSFGLRLFSILRYDYRVLIVKDLLNTIPIAQITPHAISFCYFNFSVSSATFGTGQQCQSIKACTRNASRR